MAVLLAACDGDAPAAAAGAATGTPGASAGAGRLLPIAPVARYVKLQALTELKGQPWAAVAEFDLLDPNGAAVDRTGWSASADSADISDVPANAIDGNPKSHWHSRWQGDVFPMPHELVVKLKAPTRISGFRYLPRQDNTSNGTIARYKLYVSANGADWGEPVVSGDLAAAGAGAGERVVVFAAQTPNQAPVLTPLPPQTLAFGRPVSLEIKASDADSDPLTFSATGLPTGLALAPSRGLVTGTPIVPGEYDARITVGDPKRGSASTDIRLTVSQPAPLPATTAAAPAGAVRFVKLEALSEVNGKPWGSIAELKLFGDGDVELERNDWSASADSADLSDVPQNAIDGNPASIWHSQWDGASPPPPHALIVDMGRLAKVRGIRYLPRQDELSNGVIAKFRIYTSVDGVKWSKPVAEGDFSMIGPALSEKTVRLR